MGSSQGETKSRNAAGPYAQYLLRGSPNGEFYLLHGSYTNHMLRTPDGWRIERIIQRRSWGYGNTSAVTEAIARAQAPANQATASQATTLRQSGIWNC